MLKAKNRKIAKITGEIQSAIPRVKNSASFSALGDVLNTLEGLLHKCKQMHAFQTLVNSSCPEPATFIECKAGLKRLQVNIGKSYCELELKLQARQAMMRDDAASLCSESSRLNCAAVRDTPRRSSAVRLRVMKRRWSTSTKLSSSSAKSSCDAMPQRVSGLETRALR